jgi:Ger(x)C family germination protein
MGVTNVRQSQLKLFLVFLLFFPLLTGCWDRLEIESRAVVLAIAIDEAKSEDETNKSEATHLTKNLTSSTTGAISISVQIAVPGRIPLGPGGSSGGDGGGGGQGSKSPVWVLSATGETIDDALMNLQQQIDNRLFLGHLRMIVVSEAIARRGLQNLNDYFRRQPEVRRTAWMVVSKGTAIEFMTATPQLERVPTLYLLATMDQAVKMGRLPNDFLGVFFSASSAHGQEGYLPYLKLKKKSNIEIAGLAYFKGEKMVGSTNALQIGNFMAMKQMNPGGYSFIQQIPGTETLVMLQAIYRKSRISVDIKDGKPHATIRCMLEEDIREKSNEDLSLTEDSIKKIEETFQKEASKAFKNLIMKTQKDGSDIFGIGEYVRAMHSSYWNREIKTKEKWEQIYPDISIDLFVRVKVRRIGTKVK